MSLLSKLGWRLLKDPQSLWARVLCSKYAGMRKGSQIIRHIPGASPLWRGLSRCVPILSQGIRSNITNGKNTKFWTDIWSGNEPLIKHVLCHVPQEALSDTVDKYWDKDTGWKWNLFGNILPAQHLLKLTATQVNPLNPKEDGLTWSLTQSGQFSTSSAYDLVRPKEKDVVVKVWKVLWNISCPEKFKTRAWLAIYDRLATKCVLWKRRIISSPLCTACYTSQEDVIHCLRDCPQATQVWNKLVAPRARLNFYAWEKMDWFYNNCTGQLGKDSNKDWSVIFLTTIWFLWWWRCCRCFNEETKIPYNKIEVVLDQVKTIGNAMSALDFGKDNNPRTLIYIGWSPPPHDWVKLNTDGASKGNPGRAGAGGVLRSFTGQWMLGFARNLGVCTSVAAELWAVSIGLECAWSEGMRKVILEVDSTIAIKLIQDTIDWSNPNANLIWKCQQLLREDWVVELKHILREGNSVADALANKAIEMEGGTYFFDSPPLGTALLVFQDLSGVSHPRLVHM